MMASKIASSEPFDLRGLRGILRCQESMARHTSWRVGGPADWLYLPADKADAVALMERVPSQMPVTWLGLGSNLLVRDGGVEGLVIKTVKSLGNIQVRNGNRLYVEAGVTCARVARQSVGAGLAGAEFLAGVPGSFGGALAMNAGAFGGETWSLIRQVECVDRDGNLIQMDRETVRYHYRHVDLPKGMALLSGMLELRAADGQDGWRVIRDLLSRRSASQPIQNASAGSVFKNPPGEYAARCIEQVGLKGVVRGGACFSDKHANFIINKGHATAADIECLIEQARQQVWEQNGIRLEPEVRVIGRAT